MRLLIAALEIDGVLVLMAIDTGAAVSCMSEETQKQGEVAKAKGTSPSIHYSATYIGRGVDRSGRVPGLHGLTCTVCSAGERVYTAWPWLVDW